MAGDCVTETSVNACAQYNSVRIEWVCELPDCGTNATSINARGDVVGTRSGQFLDPSAMLFRRDGSQVVLGNGTAEDINNSGAVAGRGAQAYAAIWKAGDLFQAPATTSVAWAINARGWATGTTFLTDAPYDEAFFWDPSENRVIRLDPAATGSEAHDINDLGDIVGTTHQLEQAVIWHVTRNQ